MYAGGRNVSDALARAARAFPVLLERSHQTAGTLSGGQQQMLAVARALVSDAPLILADELSVGLAPVIVDEIYAAVGEMRNQGRSLLIVEQYVGRALALADYVYVLHKGRIVFVGEPEQCQHSQIFERYMGSAA
jgi:branched-chain amino acid transport system ATP-binding protein